MYQNILLPVDIAHIGKTPAMIELAQNLADNNARITLLTVIEDVPGWVTVSLPENILENSRRFAEEKLNEIAQQAEKPELIVDVRSGHAYQTILEVAEHNAIDLIILDSHRPDLGNYLLGSTASRVVRHANCSVLVKRQPYQPRHN